MVRTVDSDVVVLCVAHFHQTVLSELWISFGTGKEHRIIPAHLIAQKLGEEKALAVMMLHAFTGCDQTSAFLNKGKKSSWDTFNIYPKVVSVFANLCRTQPIFA